MKSVTAAYWMPVTVEGLEQSPGRYVGYSQTRHQGIEEWMTKGLNSFVDIYGTVVDAHYTVESVDFNDDGNYDFILNIVVTGFVDSELDCDDKVFDHWPADIVEQLKEAQSESDLSDVVGWDFNPIQNDPVWSNYRS